MKTNYDELNEFGIKELRDGLTLEGLKNCNRYSWILDENVEIEDAILGLGPQRELVWYDGIWYDGIWRSDNDPITGHNWFGGVWKNGTWQHGQFAGGIWEDGVWENGTFSDAVWKNGTWEDGYWESGSWENGHWVNGCWEGSGSGWIKGTFEDEEQEYPWDKNNEWLERMDY